MHVFRFTDWPYGLIPHGRTVGIRYSAPKGRYKQRFHGETFTQVFGQTTDRHNVHDCKFAPLAIGYGLSDPTSIFQSSMSSMMKMMQYQMTHCRRGLHETVPTLPLYPCSRVESSSIEIRSQECNVCHLRYGSVYITCCGLLERKQHQSKRPDLPRASVPTVKWKNQLDTDLRLFQR